METYSDLKAQIQRQSEAAEVTSDHCKKLEDEIVKLKKENQILRDGLKIVGPLATRPDPA